MRVRTIFAFIIIIDFTIIIFTIAFIWQICQTCALTVQKPLQASGKTLQIQIFLVATLNFSNHLFPAHAVLQNTHVNRETDLQPLTRLSYKSLNTVSLASLKRSKRQLTRNPQTASGKDCGRGTISTSLKKQPVVHGQSRQTLEGSVCAGFFSQREVAALAESGRLGCHNRFWKIIITQKTQPLFFL